MKNRAVRSTSAGDAHGKGDIRSGHGCTGGSNLWNTPSRKGVERNDSLETDGLREQNHEMKYGAIKAEKFAVVTLVEKYRAYLGSEPFKLQVDNRALSWLKTYSMDQSYIGRWIVRLDGYNMIIEHRTRENIRMPAVLQSKCRVQMHVNVNVREYKCI